MSGITITKYEKVDPPLKPCVCGSTDLYANADHGCGFSAYGVIRCEKCGLEMTESNNSCGWGGVTVESLYRTVASRWNSVMSRVERKDA